MSDRKLGGVPLQVLVRGGTTSARHDSRRARARAAAQRGRQQLARQQQAAAAGPRMTREGFTAAKLHSLKMMDRGHPQLVLYYMNRDGTVKQECISEVFLVGPDAGFTLVCPRCLERGEPHGQSQMQVMNAHRKFYLDQRKAGTMVQLTDPDGNPIWVRICGTVSCDDVIACDSCGLFRARIEDSKVWEV